ncbi:MAG: hypothetical protein AAFY58_05080, partial [Planctomycetota bacterium]
MAMPADAVRYRVATPAGRVGAIAVIDLFARDAMSLDDALAALGAGGVRVGGWSLRDVAGVDEAVVVRWSVGHAQLMPHASSAATTPRTTARPPCGIKCACPTDQR